MADPDPFDVAGAAPNNGVVLHGIRLITTTAPKAATLGNAIRHYVSPMDRAEWHDVTLSEADSGKQLAVRRFEQPRFAKRARKHLAAALDALGPDGRAAADLQALLDAVPTSRR